MKWRAQIADPETTARSIVESVGAIEEQLGEMSYRQKFEMGTELASLFIVCALPEEQHGEYNKQLSQAMPDLEREFGWRKN